MTIRNEPQVISVEEAGKRLGIGRSSAYDAVRRGEIPHLRIGRRVVIPLAALAKLLEDPSGRREEETLQKGP